jgi:lipopolysaccharide/colanic/teichoic acid biosynthesis glycosyltransferase
MESTTRTISTAIAMAQPGTSGAISPWCVSRHKHLFDIAASCLLLVLTFPAMLVIALLVRMSSRGPILFSQRRVGLGGKDFSLLKFRSMTHGRPDQGLALTRRADSRVTSVGRFLRRFKLDELPQFFNVIRGDMSLVGPRPDVPEYYESLNDAQQQVLLLRPGVTGAAALHFRNEEVLLSRIPQAELVSFYSSTLLPKKISIDLEYAQHATLWTDLILVFRTVACVLLPHTALMDPSAGERL